MMISILFSAYPETTESIMIKGINMKTRSAILETEKRGRTTLKYSTFIATNLFLLGMFLISLALTPWMLLTPDIQVIRPAQKDVVTLIPPTRQGIDTATVVGVRLQMQF